jgi:hypothetical protein
MHIVCNNRRLYPNSDIECEDGSAIARGLFLKSMQMPDNSSKLMRWAQANMSDDMKCLSRES